MAADPLEPEATCAVAAHGLGEAAERLCVVDPTAKGNGIKASTALVSTGAGTVCPCRAAIIVTKLSSSFFIC